MNKQMLEVSVVNGANLAHLRTMIMVDHIRALHDAAPGPESEPRCRLELKPEKTEFGDLDPRVTMVREVHYGSGSRELVLAEGYDEMAKVLKKLGFEILKVPKKKAAPAMAQSQPAATGNAEPAGAGEGNEQSKTEGPASAPAAPEPVAA